MKIRPFILFIVVLISNNLSSQTIKDPEEPYKDANSYFYFEDYEEALDLYLKVYADDPNNYNLSYRIGLCYLNIPGYKEKAIPYLEKAAENTSKWYNEQSILEKKAPIDAIFYLGNAYFVTNQLDKAISTYQRFQNIIKSEKKWNLEYFNHQLETAKNSKTIQSLPVDFLRQNLGEEFNDRFANFNPVVSFDGNTMVYTTKRKFYQAINVTRKVNGNWTPPVNITLDLQVDGNCSSLSVSNDGNEIYLFKDDNLDGNIYVTRFVAGKWKPMKKLNENINTKYYETHASISSDGKKLYFTSNRKGGYGDLDIYVSERDTGDSWRPATNLGPVINSPMNENTPFVTSDGLTLYFSSESHNNMGGYDIFFSQMRQDGTWGKPINLGYPLNTTDDDLFFTPISDGAYGLMALFDSDGYGEQDLYQIEIFVPKYLKTIVTKSDIFERKVDKRFKTLVIDTLNSDGVALYDPGKSDQITYIDPLKKYKLFYHGKGFNLRDQADRAKLLIAQLQANKTQERIGLSLENKTSPNVINEDFATIEKRLSQLKKTDDSIRVTSAKNNRNLSTIEPKTEVLNTAPENKILAETNYLPDILLIISKNGSQEKIAKLLQLNWQMPTSLLKLKINQITQSADSSGDVREFLNIFTKFVDLISGSNYIAQQKQQRAISDEETNSSFTYLLNQIISKASPELSVLLGQIYQEHPEFKTFDEFWKFAELQHPDTFKSHIPEIVRLLAEIGVESYVNLPEDQKLALYQNVVQSAEPKPYLWISLIVIFGLIGIGGYLYMRRK